MATTFVPNAACFAAAKAAANGKISDREVLDAFQRVADYRDRLQASGSPVGRDAAIRKFAAGEAERARIAAAMQRRHTALNVIRRQRLDAQLDGYLASGMSPRKALLAIDEGTQRGVKNARVSTSAMRAAYRGRYTGAMMAELERDAPELLDMLNDKQLDSDVVREMMELKQGGKPGSTGNKSAQTLAGIFAKYAELARTDLNGLGASIGKLDGWAGAQVHDDLKLIAAGKDAWIGRIATMLDLERTFPEGPSPNELVDTLGSIYDTIITGVDNTPGGAELGQRVNPANLAKSLGKSRVLHFKDADATLRYRDEFGHGNSIAGMFHHLEQSARVAANMEVWGPNPENMFQATAKLLARKIKESPRYTDEQKNKFIGQLRTEAGALRIARDIGSGAVSRPVNMTIATIGSNIRAVESMSKLGGMLLTSMPTDTMGVAQAAQFRGSSALGAIFQQIAGILHGRDRGEGAEISYMMGEGFEGLLGHILSPYVGHDTPIGKVSRWQSSFFKWTGNTWWTDVSRAVAGRTVAAEMGMRAGTAFDALPAAYRKVLGMHGIDEARWQAISSAVTRQHNGKAYVTPDALLNLDDDQVMHLVDPSRAKAAQNDPERLASLAAQEKKNLQLALIRFVADETSYGVITTDAKSQRLSTWGTRPGTMAGEAVRMVMQFKGFPLAFTDRVVGRAVMGYSKEERWSQAAHLGTILGGLTIAGYMSIVLKDAVKGYWPPRDPSDPRNWMAAMQQGGAWGIYGDFLFSQTNRFGGGLLETLAGPTLGSISNLTDTALNARDAGLGTIAGDQVKLNAAKAFSNIVQTTPYANLFFVKPVLDYLWLDSMREALSPGYLRRQDKDRRSQYGQTRLDPFGLGRTLQQKIAQ